MQSKCEDLVNQVSTILASGSYGTPDYSGFAMPFSPPEHGVDAAGGSTHRSEPIVKVYRDIRFGWQMVR